MNDEINSAREVTKTNSVRLQTFETRGYGVMGVVDRDRVVYYRDTLKRHTADSEFDVCAIESLPRVDILMTYQGASGDLVEAAADAGAAGIVMATAGAGATSGTSNYQEGICWSRPLRCSYTLQNLIAILPGQLSAKFIYFTDTVTASLLTSDQDSVLVFRLYIG